MPVVYGYSGHFLQLFQNLVGNALKYRGTEPPRVHVSCRREKSRDFTFAVSDNGIGIDPVYHSKIFGIFKRLHGKQIPGTGMGLAICQRVVERYSGRLWVESSAGGGSTFCFTLPAEMAVPHAEAAPLRLAMREAFALFGDGAAVSRAQVRAMTRDFSWDRPAREYESVYDAAVARAAG